MLDNLKRTCYDVDTPKVSSSDRPSREHAQQAGGARADRHKNTAPALEDVQGARYGSSRAGQELEARKDERTVNTMKKTVKDGWHKIAGYDVYVKSGNVKRGVTADGQRATYPYRASKCGGWDNDPYMSVDNFRRKVNNGTAAMF